MLQLLALLGFPLGRLINRYTFEELEQGKIYFYWGYKTLLAAIAILLLIQRPLFVPVLIGVLASRFIKEEFLYLGLIPATLPMICTTTILATISAQKRILRPILAYTLAVICVSITGVNLTAVAAGALLALSFK